MSSTTAAPRALAHHAYLSSLDEDWARLAYSPTAIATFNTWAETFPVLSDYSLPELPYDMRAADQATSDTVLLALLMLAQDGHQLAGRTVLQCFRHFVWKTSRRTTRTLIHRGTSRADHFASATAEAWIAILEYPLHRASKVATNLSMEIVRRLTPSWKEKTAVSEITFDPFHLPQAKERYALPASDFMYDSPEESAVRSATPLSDASSTDINFLMDWALRLDVLTRDQVSLVRRYYLTEAHARAELARSLGLTPAALRKKVSRAITALRHHVVVQMDSDNS